jgi:hypothetical protein
MGSLTLIPACAINAIDRETHRDRDVRAADNALIFVIYRPYLYRNWLILEQHCWQEIANRSPTLFP